MRWTVVEQTSQGALFGGLGDGDEVFERRPGEGQFEGMEFLHVRARSIINPVPEASRMPFRYTINVYRGCSHACTYCLLGDTPILMADGRTKPLEEVRVGDAIYGTVGVGDYRRYVRTTVLDHWRTEKPAIRVVLSDGSALVASGDHRFLTNRGWKHVLGAECGALRRPHLTTSNRLLGIGSFATPPVHDGDYQRGYLAGMIRGDGHLASYPADHEGLDRAAAFLTGSGVHTDRFEFSAATARRRAMSAIRCSARDAVAAVAALVEWPPAPSPSWSKGFLAGIFDAEGSYSYGVLRISNTDPTIVTATVDAMSRFGFDAVVEGSPRLKAVRLLGGLSEHVRFFHTVDPAITRKLDVDGRAVKNSPGRRVVAIEPLGVVVPMYDLTTGTGDFIANGAISHNCFARPTHEYLDMDAGRDFERRIVVKVNAVERLRAELRSRRWKGEAIAMGTNTDPYQRCEGKYRLTRGVIEALGEVRNPFSILTKSALILRDLDVLTEAARRADVRASLSIGTLDEAVWRSSEPGTPHPLRRVEAVRRLNDAGIPTGVLMAPVLPGLSDRPEQLEAVVAACVEAGATSISAMYLHLRPGVREQYLPWLERTYPDLAARYAELYPRAYVPKASSAELSSVVREMVDRHRRTAPPRRRRVTREGSATAPAPPTTTPSPNPTQLSLPT